VNDVRAAQLRVVDTNIRWVPAGRTYAVKVATAGVTQMGEDRPRGVCQDLAVSDGAMSYMRTSIKTTALMLLVASTVECTEGDDSEKLDCTFERRCKLLNPGNASCFDEISNPNPCCGSLVQGAILYACEQGTSKCLTFSNYCLPSGWIATDRPDGALAADTAPPADAALPADAAPPRDTALPADASQQPDAPPGG